MDAPAGRRCDSPTSDFILNLGVWGDASRRHHSIEVKGSLATKTGADYQSSTAVSRVPAYGNFFAEIKIVKCMRGTSIGLAVPTIDLDQQWYVSRLMKTERDVRQRELDKALHAQIVEQGHGRVAGDRRQEGKEHAAQPRHQSLRAGSPARTASPPVLTREESLANSDFRKKQLQAEFEARQRKQDLRKQIWKTNLQLNEVDDSIQGLERKVQDLWGPRVWFLTCDGLFGAGAECIDTGVKYTDGDIVRVELENSRLMFYVNGQEIAKTACTVETRTFLAVCLQNKGASLEIVHSSLEELEDRKNAAVLEEISGEQAEAEVMQIGSPISAVASPFAAAAGMVPVPSILKGSPDIINPAQAIISPPPWLRRQGTHRGSLVAYRSLSADSSSAFDHEEFEDVFQKIAQMMDKANAWSVLQKSLFVYDPDGTGFISRQHFIELMHQLRFTDQVMGKSAEEVFSYLDEEEAGQIEYVEFVDAVTLASEQNSNPGPVTWGKIHEDFEYDAEANSVTATGTKGRAALLTKLVSKGKHRFEFYVKQMSGSVFIGLLQATRKVYMEGNQRFVETKTRELDDNWYYSPEAVEFSAWYISDIGVIRKDSSTIAAGELEFGTGDTITIEVNMDRKELSFLVGGKRTGPQVRNLEGEFYPAVFISGDEGDCVVLVKGEVVKGHARRSFSRSFSKIVGLVSAPSSPLRGAVQDTSASSATPGATATEESHRGRAD